MVRGVYGWARRAFNCRLKCRDVRQLCIRHIQASMIAVNTSLSTPHSVPIGLGNPLIEKAVQQPKTKPAKLSQNKRILGKF